MVINHETQERTIIREDCPLIKTCRFPQYIYHTKPKQEISLDPNDGVNETFTYVENLYFYSKIENHDPHIMVYLHNPMVDDLPDKKIDYFVGTVPSDFIYPIVENIIYKFLLNPLVSVRRHELEIVNATR